MVGSGNVSAPKIVGRIFSAPVVIGQWERWRLEGYPCQPSEWLFSNVHVEYSAISGLSGVPRGTGQGSHGPVTHVFEVSRYRQRRGDIEAEGHRALQEVDMKGPGRGSLEDRMREDIAICHHDRYLPWARALAEKDDISLPLVNDVAVDGVSVNTACRQRQVGYRFDHEKGQSDEQQA